MNDWIRTASYHAKGSPRTRLAFLVTLSELHQVTVAGALDCLYILVMQLAPDLLCAEITHEMWKEGDLSRAAVEVREVLIPLAVVTDIVLIPIAPDFNQLAVFAPETGWRHTMVRLFDRLFRRGQRRVDSLEAINGLLFEVFCYSLYMMEARFWTAEKRKTFAAQNKSIADDIIWAVRRNAGCRVLVVMQSRRIHKLKRLLKAYKDELDLVRYRNL